MTLKFNLESLQSKAKERTVKTQSIEYDLETMVKKIKNGIIKLDPDYQRRHRWDNGTSSRLIESLILNIPIPILYLSYDIDVDANEEGARYSVIDGQQRLTAIKKFFDNEFALEDLDILDDLEGCLYRDLPPFLLRRLEERTVKCLRIDSTIDPQVKYDIFERLNSGAVKLESHELRNAVLRGPFNDLCKQLATNPKFRILLQIPPHDAENSPKVKKMEDVELVLRFMSLIDENYKNYKKSKDNQFKHFLSDSLRQKNMLSTAEMEKYRTDFLRTIDLIYDGFGENAFAKYREDNGVLKLQSSFNTAVYDALMVGVGSEVSILKSITSKQVTDFRNLFKDANFHESLSGSVMDTSKLVSRITSVRKIMAQ